MFKLPDKPFYVIQQFLASNKTLVYKYLIKKIKYAINNNIQKVDLFEFPTDGKRHIAVVHEKDFEKVLMDAITSFSESEEYETAASAQQILQTYRDIQINKLLNEIKQGD